MIRRRGGLFLYSIRSTKKTAFLESWHISLMCDLLQCHHIFEYIIFLEDSYIFEFKILLQEGPLHFKFFVWGFLNNKFFLQNGPLAFLKSVYIKNHHQKIFFINKNSILFYSKKKCIQKMISIKFFTWTS